MDQNQKNGSHYYKKIIIALVLGWVAIWIYRTILTPIYPQIQEALGNASNAEIGLIASVYFFAYTGMQIPAGALVDKFGQKSVLIPAFIGFAIGAVVLGTSSTLIQVYLGSLIAGLATGSYYGAAYSLSAKHVPKDKKTFANAVINSGSAVGMVIGLIGSSVLVGGLNIDWNWMLYGTALIILGVTFIFFINIKSDKQLAAMEEENNGGVKVDAKPVVEEDDGVSLFSGKHLTIYFVYFAVCYGYYMIVTWLPSFLVAEKGFAQSDVGYVSALVAIAGIPGALIFARILDRRQQDRLKYILGLLIVAAVMIGLTVYSPSPWILYIALILYGLFGKLAIDPVLITYVSDSVPEHKTAKALGLFNFFGMASSVVAPWLTGFIGDTTGSQIIGFYIGTILLLVAAALFFLVIYLRDGKNSQHA
ncbi:MFS transporter [Jeotgalicoccus meleagridis]|uniref:Hexuronate transporter n=1 Tax=Jeotgalicoccus meleagridis TaxID=2759181 RepID=A0A6V7RKU9_9STAP|nr:MFS transporter [Jeotgalicoccus meleagridis]CAD2078846.1 Hexuronate transporter [Jeotgalicoccus meleagridis]